MKYLLAMLLCSATGAAMADDLDAPAPTPVEDYSYAQHLDIAHVLSVTAVPNVCAVVPARMTYEDSQGQRHVLEYRVMGNGCSNG